MQQRCAGGRGCGRGAIYTRWDIPPISSCVRLTTPPVAPRNDGVLASGTTHELLDGSGLSFEFRGAHELKGLSGARPIFALVR